MTNPHILYELAQAAEQERMNEALRVAAIRAARAERGPSRARRLLAKVFRGAPVVETAPALNDRPAMTEGRAAREPRRVAVAGSMECSSD